MPAPIWTDERKGCVVFWDNFKTKLEDFLRLIIPPSNLITGEWDGIYFIWFSFSMDTQPPNPNGIKPDKNWDFSEWVISS